MKCEKCGFENSEFDIICEKCGSPLNIENNIELKRKYNAKPRAIDIESIALDNTEKIFDNTKQKVRYFLAFFLGSIFIVIISFSAYLISNSKASDIITKYNNFMDNTKLGIIYLGIDNDVNKELKNYANNYDIEYMYINLNKVTSIKRKKLKEKLKLKKIDSTLVIVKDGNVIDSINGCNTETNKIELFLMNNEIIPKELGDTSSQIAKFDEAINSNDATIIYIANNKNTSNEEHNKKLKEFCTDYSINYTFVEGYYLSDSQKLSLLNKVNYSEIHDEFLILVDEGEIKYVTELVSSEQKEYFELMSTYGIIDSTSVASLNEINLDRFKKIVSSNEKNITILTSDNCLYCDRIKPIIGKIGIQNNVTIYNLHINEKNQNSLIEYLSEIGYDESVSFPLVIISENGKILDYVIGFSDKEFYIEKFKELGVIR